MNITRARVATLVTALTVLFGASLIAAFTHFASAATTVNSGDLIRGESFSAVYYMGADGFRYVFPNDKTYFTWYENFDTVKWVSDAELAAIQIGGNVTYKPYTRMIKINTDPKVYFVKEGGALFSVKDEATATLMYGSDWNTQIDDVPDGFFSNYTLSGQEIGPEEADVAALDYDGTINDDKGLIAPLDISIDGDGFSDVNVTVVVGQTVRFTNNDSSKHSVTADDLTWGSGTMTTGVTFVRRFDEAGTFTYFDGYDSSNTGTITVE